MSSRDPSELQHLRLAGEGRAVCGLALEKAGAEVEAAESIGGRVLIGGSLAEVEWCERCLEEHRERGFTWVFARTS